MLAGRQIRCIMKTGMVSRLVFCIIAISLLTVMQQYALQWMRTSGIATGVNGRQLKLFFGDPGVLYPAYLICFLVCVRGIVYLVRLRNNPRVEVGLAALIVVALMAALIPYSLQLHYNDYQPLDYDPTWQTSNWIFTMATSLEGRLPNR